MGVVVTDMPQWQLARVSSSCAVGQELLDICRGRMIERGRMGQKDEHTDPKLAVEVLLRRFLDGPAHGSFVSGRGTVLSTESAGEL